MAHSNCGKRIKLRFVDLNCRFDFDEYHTGVVQLKSAVCHQYSEQRLTERHSCAKKNVFAPTFFFAAPGANFQMSQCTYCEQHSVTKPKEQESPANAKGTRDSSACMKAHCEQM